MQSKKFTRKKVYGSFQRLLHWWIAALSVELIAMGWLAKAMDSGAPKIWLSQFHIVVGYALGLGLVLRLFWALVGPNEAKFSALWFPEQWKCVLQRKSIHRTHKWGHDPTASFAYLAFYLGSLTSILTGLVLAGIRFDRGPFHEVLFDSFHTYDFFWLIHNLVLYLATGFVAIHITGLIFHEQKTGKAVAQSMVSGYQYGDDESGGT